MQNEQATIIQSHARVWLARRAVMQKQYEQHVRMQSCITIQRVWRGRLGRKEAAEAWVAREEVSTHRCMRVIRAWRGGKALGGGSLLTRCARCIAPAKRR